MYYRRQFSFPSYETQYLKWLIGINVGIFAIQKIVVLWFGLPVVEALFALSSPNIFRFFLWTPITYAFLHGDVWHLFFNMLFLFFIGRIVESEEGGARFLKIYFLSLVLAGLVWLGLHLDVRSPLVGASGANMGILTYYCLTHREQPLTLLVFFVLPLTLMPMWIVWGFFGFEFFNMLFNELPGKTAIASSAHLGGMLGGFLYTQWIRSPWASKFSFGSKIKIEKPNWFRKAPKSRASFKVNIKGWNSKAKQEELNRILDKINAEGFGALSQKERDFLDNAKDFFKK